MEVMRIQGSKDSVEDQRIKGMKAQRNKGTKDQKDEGAKDHGGRQQ